MKHQWCEPSSTQDSEITISIGNHMDEGVIWEKITQQQKNCMRRSRVLFELFYISAFFSQNRTLIHAITY